ncbi:hypothetical protein WCE41_14110 [Luteimonas sp. MJ246]|uniref:hypothetical protein n=1 Tax=Luteimonas sp. MJ174 TaxID=3129237 RepID=UPI0031BAC9BF
MTRFLAPFLVVLCSCAAGVTVSPESASIEQLVRASRGYNNAIVEVRGFAVMRWEANFICQSLDDIDSNLNRCLWLTPMMKDGKISPLDPATFHQKELVIVGVFDRENKGHGGAYPVAIAPLRVRQVGTHHRGEVPPPPPKPAANKSFKPTPLRGAA